MTRSREEVDRLYALLDDGIRRQGRWRRLGDETASRGLPTHGVYFLFEERETREDGSTPRVVRVGTHGLSATSRATLWGRLRAHRGTSAGGGNHRGSVFRLHVGAALLARDGGLLPTWGVGGTAAREVMDREREHEARVSRYMSELHFTWIPALTSEARAWLERNAIALLSNAPRPGSGVALDPPSDAWLGRHSARAVIRSSGLWNVRHVEELPRSGWLDELEALLWRDEERERQDLDGRTP